MKKKTNKKQQQKNINNNNNNNNQKTKKPQNPPKKQQQKKQNKPNPYALIHRGHARDVSVPSGLTCQCIMVWQCVFVLEGLCVWVW